MKPKKVIVVTDLKYSEKYTSLLEELYSREIVLFCAWGRYCSQWELAFDIYVTDPVRMDESHHITTTSHSDEPFEDVQNMADMWVIENGNNEVEIIRL